MPAAAAGRTYEQRVEHGAFLHEEDVYVGRRCASGERIKRRTVAQRLGLIKIRRVCGSVWGGAAPPPERAAVRSPDTCAPGYLAYAAEHLGNEQDGDGCAAARFNRTAPPAAREGDSAASIKFEVERTRQTEDGAQRLGLIDLQACGGLG